MYFIGKKVFHWALSFQPLYSMSKSVILWSKLTLVLTVLSMWMTLLLCINLPLSMLFKENYSILYYYRLEKWTLTNVFTISKNKTIAMHFCPDKKCMDPVFKLDNDHIQFVKEAKFLGLIWDIKNSHLNRISISQSTVSKVPKHPESPLSYRMGCRSNFIVEIISLPG